MINEGLAVKCLGIDGDTLNVEINGSKYGYSELDSGDPNFIALAEINRKFSKMIGFSAGKALAWLKKVTKLVSGSKKNIPETKEYSDADLKLFESLIEKMLKTEKFIGYLTEGNAPGFFTMDQVKEVEKLTDLDSAKEFVLSLVMEYSKEHKPKTENVYKAKNMIQRSNSIQKLMFGMSNFILAQENPANKVLKLQSI